MTTPALPAADWAHGYAIAPGERILVAAEHVDPLDYIEFWAIDADGNETERGRATRRSVSVLNTRLFAAPFTAERGWTVHAKAVSGDAVRALDPLPVITDDDYDLVFVLDPADGERSITWAMYQNRGKRVLITSASDSPHDRPVLRIGATNTSNRFDARLVTLRNVTLTGGTLSTFGGQTVWLDRARVEGQRASTVWASQFNRGVHSSGDTTMVYATDTQFIGHAEALFGMRRAVRSSVADCSLDAVKNTRTTIGTVIAGISKPHGNDGHTDAIQDFYSHAGGMRIEQILHVGMVGLSIEAQGVHLGGGQSYGTVALADIWLTGSQGTPLGSNMQCPMGSLVVRNVHIGGQDFRLRTDAIGRARIDASGFRNVVHLSPTVRQPGTIIYHGAPHADITGDGVVNFADLNEVMNAFGEGN